MSHERSLDGSLAVVTGAFGKLGPHWVRALAGAGASVVGIDLRRDGADDLGVGFRFEQGDVTDRASLDAVRERIADLGAPQVLVNNAGIDQPPEAEARRYRVEDV